MESCCVRVLATPRLSIVSVSLQMTNNLSLSVMTRVCSCGMCSRPCDQHLPVDVYCLLFVCQRYNMPTCDLFSTHSQSTYQKEKTLDVLYIMLHKWRWMASGDVSDRPARPCRWRSFQGGERATHVKSQCLLSLRLNVTLDRDTICITETSVGATTNTGRYRDRSRSSNEQCGL